jgi:virulence-associated protein VapD
MFAIAFDLVVADAQAHHPRSVAAAYADIGRTLGEHGFENVQGSVYLSRDENLVALTAAMNALKALPWFPRCVRDIRAFRVEQWSDFTGFVRG